MENIKLSGMYNKIICNYHGATSGIIFDYLIHSDYIYVGNSFKFENLKDEFMFMNEKELKEGLNELIKSGYVTKLLDDLMKVSNKAIAFLPDEEE